MHNLLKSRSLASIFVLGGGNVIGTLISAITLIIFSRLLGPTDFGLFSSAFALMQIMVRLVDSGTTTATERALARAHAKSPASYQSIMTISVYLKLGLYVFWLLVGLVGAEYLATNYLGLSDSRLIKTALVIALGTVVFEYATVVFQSAGQFGLVARITLAQALGKLLGGLILLSQSVLTATTALWLYGLMPLLGTIAGWVNTPHKLSLRLNPTWSKDLHSLLSVAKWTGVAAISASLADNLDTLMVQSMMTLHDTGIWAGASRIATFASILPWTVGSVLNIRVTQFHEKKHLFAYLKKARWISLGSAFLILLLLPFAGLITTLTIGPEYQSGVSALRLMFIATALLAMTTPIASLYYLFDKPQYYAYAGLISTILLISMDYLLIPLFGLHGAAYARIIVRSAVLIFTLIYTAKTLKERYGK